MSAKSTIEWTDATWNPITGCTLVDDGCRHCYAAHLITSWPAIGNHPSRVGLARKNAAGESKFTGEVRFNAEWLTQPLRGKRPRLIFVCAHGDLIHEAVPDAWIDEGKRDEKDGQIGIVGYEINFNRYFYQYQPPRPLAQIDADLKAIEAEIAALLGEVTE